MGSYVARVEWSLAEGRDAFLAGHYSRGHTVRFDAGVTLPASSSPSSVKLPWSVEAAADPEEMLIAALSSCHMLWFLDFAKRAGVTVTGYRDEAVGRMGKFAQTGKIGVTECVLRPVVESDATAEQLAHLHHQAHEACNIANSCLTEVRVEAPTEAALTKETIDG